MQTFLPYADYRKTARSLDRVRLGNQAYRECRVLVNRDSGWEKHPARRMWYGYEAELCRYALILLQELKYAWGRNYPHHFEFFQEKLQEHTSGPPPWIGDERVHRSHRAVLLRKGLEDETFRRYKGKKVKLVKGSQKFWRVPHYKKDWPKDLMQKLWDKFGQPPIEETWYGEFGWDEEPAERNPDGSWPYYWPV